MCRESSRQALASSLGRESVEVSLDGLLELEFGRDKLKGTCLSRVHCPSLFRDDDEQRVGPL